MYVPDFSVKRLPFGIMRIRVRLRHLSAALQAVRTRGIVQKFAHRGFVYLYAFLQLLLPPASFTAAAISFGEAIAIKLFYYPESKREESECANEWQSSFFIMVPNHLFYYLGNVVLNLLFCT